ERALLGHVGREALRLEVREHHADRAGELADPPLADGRAQEPDVARHLGGHEARHEARETPRQRRLAGAAGAHHDGERALPELQVEIDERRPRGTRVGAAEPPHRDRGVAHKSARPTTASPSSGTSPSPTWNAPVAVWYGAQGASQSPLEIS